MKGSQKEVLNGKFHNTRPLGKPETRWEDFIRMDTSQVLGIGGLRRRAEFREEWRRLMVKARDQKGL